MRYLLLILLLSMGCSPTSSEEVYGCKEQDACNYNPNATKSDNVCLYLDCLNECGGDAEIDECGDCNGGNLSCSDGCGIPNNMYEFTNINGDQYEDENGYFCEDLFILYHINPCFIKLDSDHNPNCSDYGDVTFFPPSDENAGKVETLSINAYYVDSIPIFFGYLSAINKLTIYVDINVPSDFSIIPPAIGQLNTLDSLNLLNIPLIGVSEAICDINDCEITLDNNQLCNIYNFECIDSFTNQDQSNCCAFGDKENWIECP